VILCVNLAMAAETPAPGKQVPAATTVIVDGEAGKLNVTLRYLLYLPADYDTKPSEKWPLVLFLHGSGERGDDIEKVKIHGPPNLASQGKEFPFVLCSPQCPTGSRWNAEELSKLVDELANTYRIDRRRLYVTGPKNSPQRCHCAAAATWSQLPSWPRLPLGYW
jgi:predicted peptidase